MNDQEPIAVDTEEKLLELFGQPPDEEMLRQMYEGWSRSLDAVLDYSDDEGVTIVGNNRIWNADYKANLNTEIRVHWIKEGF